MSADKVTFAVTGSTGFVGSALVASLAANPAFQCRAIARGAQRTVGGLGAAAGDLAQVSDLSALFEGVDVVVHAAGRAHVVHDVSQIETYRQANVVATGNVARSAVKAGVKRLVFLSTAAVHGDETQPGAMFSEADEPRPTTPYATSKVEAEALLGELSATSGLEVVVLRPPLVYGAGVKGNLHRLIRLVKAGIPLPFGAIANARSMISRDNLINAITLVAQHPAARGNTFLVSDPSDVSTPDLIRAIAAGLGRPARLVSIPPILLEAAGRLIGRSPDALRLTRSLRVDSGHLTAVTGWRPLGDIVAGLGDMARGSGN